MKRSAALVAVLAIVFLGAIKPAEKPAASDPLGVRVEITPTSNDPFQLLRKRAHPDSYACRASVYNAANSRSVMAGSEVIVMAGERQTRTEIVDGVEVTFTVAVSKDSSRAITDVTAKRGQQIVLHQQSDVALRKVP